MKSIKNNKSLNLYKKYKNSFLYIILILLVIIVIIVLFFIIKNKELFNNTNNDNYVLPKIIWVFWDKEELPKHISLILDNNKNKLFDWNINLLNNNNLKDYLDLSKFPKKYDTLSIQA